MALPDLTGQNIQDTYQRVLQLSSSKHITDGTGSLVTDLTISGTGSFGRIEVLHISSSTGDFDANTIRIGGTSFNKIDLDNLKQGKSITTTTINQDISYEQYIKPEAIISDADNSTYTKYTIAARIGTFVSGTLFCDLNLSGSNNYAVIGDGNTDIQLKGNINEATLDGGTF